MQKTLLSLIHEAKPRRALFTTYTFSISWFETFALPALRNLGCEQIDVLVDAREACKSTEEASSLHAGNAYRIFPVYMAGTKVFHPKLVYLQGREHDHLVIGSANLTLAGHGKNLEVLDAVSSYREPAVFGEFARFVEALMRKHELSPEDASILQGYQRRAEQLREAAGDIDETMRRTWLIHTVERPAADQFVALTAQLSEPRTLTVLSPYHAPSGAPVHRLAEAVGVDEIRIGLDARYRNIAPFEAAAFVEPFRFVVADTEHAHRFPHAKCFEVKGDDGVVVMTGSVNATGQSLETTDNVEVSLVRRLNESPFSWEEVEAPTEFEPCHFSVPAMTARNPALQATWTTAHRIVGQVTPVDKAQTVTLDIWDGSLHLVRIDDVSLLEDGTFGVRMREYLNSQRAMRLEMTGVDLHASGWLNVEYELSANDHERSLTRASTRVLSGDFHFSDIATIFNWLHGLHSKHSPVQADSELNVGGGKSTTTEGDTAAGPQRKISYEEWRAGVEQYRAFGVASDVARISLEAAFRWLNRDLTNTPTSPDDGGPPTERADARTAPRMRLLMTDKSEFEASNDSDDAGKDGDGDQDGEGDTLYQRLVESLPKALELDAQSAIVPLIVELSGSAILKHALQRLAPAHEDEQEEQDKPERKQPQQLVLDAWLSRFSTFDYSEVNRERLLPYFCAMACCAAHYHENSSLPTLKEALQRLAGRPCEADEVKELARMALNSRGMARVPAEDRDAVVEHMWAIQDSATISQRLERLIADTVADPKNVDVPEGYAEVFDALKQHRKAKDKVFGLVRRVAQSRACPCCYTKVHDDDLRVLQAKRAIVCNSCKRALFHDLDSIELAQRGLAGRYKG